ncbi:polyprenyl synthetase family protein [Bifidobacterium sp. SO4]|uniref:polyprenyl synthetase family protein n=1 Tax=Bifidobacterium sp. SO4 TaxID=2809030 RepID=UPI001BDD9E1C|nr:polyprenyl synthetase family protein [Bifidobacterium sp. SO4]MBT1170303.1 polyprenyl synthetase family protein [Bifidobacterium sp. SO4]
MWTTDHDLAIIEPRIAELVRELTDAPATGEVAGALRPVMGQVIDQAVASSEGGKRLRALLTLAAFDALRTDLPGSSVSGTDDDARRSMVDLACAIEVFQTAALVHDDIIDESDLRRGKPSAHRALEQAVHSGVIGRGLGLMLGDILATACIEIARRASRGLANTDAIDEAFLTMQREVEIGQVLDLGVEMTPLDDPGALADASLNVFRWKTASYTTIAPLLFAFLAAGYGPDEASGHALAIGRPLGVAFQLADDLLDVIGSSRNTGKPVGGDIREGKRTVLLADALGAAGADERGELIAMFSADRRDETQVARAIELFGSTGAIDRSRERIHALWLASREAIAELGLAAERERRLAEACARFIPEQLR